MNSEVATLVPGDIKNPLDVIIYCLNGHVQKINSTHRSYDPLHYVLLLPEGTDGWQLNMKKSNGQILTAMNFYAYQLQDFLNNLNPSGLLFHKIKLKKNCPTMLLRNFDPANGHCNGTRYTVAELNFNVIEAVIATGPKNGKRLFILRIHFIPTDNQFPLQLRCRQFPMKLAFSFTANKAQGQTLDRVGVFLPTPMFTHGQL
uniref:DNA helicase Pif1-like 2B domain-containing protein n=1 Tax=Octopus bimaculoides TaxID=37653 RepID=A0A0L8H4A4_OCTBM